MSSSEPNTRSLTKECVDCWAKHQVLDERMRGLLSQTPGPWRKSAWIAEPNSRSLTKECVGCWAKHQVIVERVRGLLSKTAGPWRKEWKSAWVADRKHQVLAESVSGLPNQTAGRWRKSELLVETLFILPGVIQRGQDQWDQSVTSSRGRICNTERSEWDDWIICFRKHGNILTGRVELWGARNVTTDVNDVTLCWQLRELLWLVGSSQPVNQSWSSWSDTIVNSVWILWFLFHTEVDRSLLLTRTNQRLGLGTVCVCIYWREEKLYCWVLYIWMDI